MGSICATESTSVVDIALDCKVLPAIYDLLKCEKTKIELKQQVLWTLSNITAGTPT